MKGKSKWSLFLALVFVMSVFLSACSGGGGNEGSSGTNTGDGGEGTTEEGTDEGTTDEGSKLADEQVMHLSFASEPPSLDITQATDTTSSAVLTRIKAGLMYDNGPDILPDLAKGEPEVSDDLTVYTYHIRDNAVWENGEPVTAKDFVWAWHYQLTPSTKAKYSFIFASANIKNAAKILDKDSDMYGKVDKLGVKAVDEKTLQITLEKPTSYFNYLMSFPPFFPLNKKFVTSHKDKYGQSPDTLLANGPYKLEKWDHGSGMTLVKNDKYWDAENVSIDKATYKIVKEAKTALKLYKTGQLEYTGISGDKVPQFKNGKDFHTVLSNCVFYAKLNQKTVPAFKNQKVRKAIWLSIDRKQAVNVLMNNGSVVANYVVPQQFDKGPDGKWFHAEGGPADIKAYPHSNDEKAKQLWKQAKEELGIDTLEVEYLTTDGSFASKMAEYYVAQVNQNLEGFKFKIKKVTWETYLELDNKGDYEYGAGSGWCPDYKDPTTFLDLFAKGNPQNTMGYKDAKFNEMMDKVHSLGAEPQKRWEMMQKAEAYLVNDAAFIPTYQDGSAVLLKTYVEGTVLSGDGLRYRHAKVMQH
ncbi:MAG TPA: peptide ABC transporter substrate-binding protein [Bacillales bacterium]|nr:peptide ABC transporter substrate-binding protein [Bacillales bacterium]